MFVESGGQVVRANVVGANGAPLGVAELDIELAARNHLVITRGRAALLALDFDLAASHDVDLAQSPPVVTARPYIVAEIEPVAEKELRLRGALVSTDVAASSYTVDVRPWFRPDGAHGRVTVHTTATTSFEIDGVPATGTAGLAALAAKPAGTHDGRVRHAVDAGAPLHGRDRACGRQRQRRAGRCRPRQHRRAQTATSSR